MSFNVLSNPLGCQLITQSNSNASRLFWREHTHLHICHEQIFKVKNNVPLDNQNCLLENIFKYLLWKSQHLGRPFFHLHESQCTSPHWNPRRQYRKLRTLLDSPSDESVIKVIELLNRLAGITRKSSGARLPTQGMDLVDRFNPSNPDTNRLENVLKRVPIVCLSLIPLLIESNRNNKRWLSTHPISSFYIYLASITKIRDTNSVIASLLKMGTH